MSEINLLKGLRIAVFGCKETSEFLVDFLLEISSVEAIVSISPELGMKANVAGYSDLRAFGERLGVRVYTAERYSLKSAKDFEFFKEESFDLGFVNGWQRLIPAEILETFSLGVFGMHGSAMPLPKGRGRSPLNWSIIEGRKHFYTNLFKYDPGVDSGQILDTFKFSIGERDTCETLHFKNSLAMKQLILRSCPAFSSGSLKLYPQSSERPTYYPKRTPENALIDWSQDVYSIDRFVRAQTKPFPGAYTFGPSGFRLIIWEAAPFDTVDFFQPYDSVVGEVMDVFPGGKFLVNCEGGLLLVHEYTSEASIVKGMILGEGKEELKTFPRNKHGNFDLSQSS